MSLRPLRYPREEECAFILPDLDPGPVKRGSRTYITADGRFALFVDRGGQWCIDSHDARPTTERQLLAAGLHRARFDTRASALAALETSVAPS